MLRPRCLLAGVAAAAALALTPASATAIVGGTDAPAGKYPYVAHVTIDKLFGCTGTLVAPTWVVSAGHCESLTGPVLATPIGTPGQLIDVRLNSIRAHEGQGERVPTRRVVVAPDYLFLNGSENDVALIELARPVNLPTVKIAGRGEEGLMQPGTLATIAGFGVTESGGSAPDVLQEAQVPITTDAYAAEAYGSGYDPRTMIAAGFAQGGVDTCQGDSGGPLMVPNAAGTLRLIGDTSFGRGCAEPGYPGVYGRVAGTKLREWIRTVAPAAIAPDATTTSTRTTTGKRTTGKRTASRTTSRA